MRYGSLLLPGTNSQKSIPDTTFHTNKPSYWIVRTSTRLVKRGWKVWREGEKKEDEWRRGGGKGPQKKEASARSKVGHAHTSERNTPKNERTSPRWKKCGWPFTCGHSQGFGFKNEVEV